jgi:hypothetical protein
VNFVIVPYIFTARQRSFCYQKSGSLQPFKA